MSLEKLWRPGVNPAVDVALFTADPTQNYRLCVLLIRRGGTSGAETDKFALPGGFIDSSAPKGHPFVPDLESPREAAVRELREEVSLHVPARFLKFVGVYDDPGRDPRNEPGVAQVVSHAWTSAIPWQLMLKAGDDAKSVEWVPLDEVKQRNLAFDHAKIIEDALAAIPKEIEILRGISNNDDRSQSSFLAKKPISSAPASQDSSTPSP